MAEASGPSVKDMIKAIDRKENLTQSDNRNKRIYRNVMPQRLPVKEDTNEAPPEDDDYSSDEDDEFSKESEKFGRYMNTPEIVDEVKNFIREEEDYSNSLHYLVTNYLKNVTTDEFDLSEVFGSVLAISSYHNNTFLPDLKSCRNVSKIADCFNKHKMLFNVYYDNYFISKPNIRMVLTENKDVFKKSYPEQQYKEYEHMLLMSLQERIETYQEFLECTKTILSKNMKVDNFERALSIIDKLSKHLSKKHENTRFIISELVQTERKYVAKLESIVTEMVPAVEKLLKRKIKVDTVVGTVPQIYSEQQEFYDALKRCLYDFNPNEVGECFLFHKDIFSLYIKDQQMKYDLDTLEECRLALEFEHKSFDFHAPLNRLYKYKLLLQELRKSCEKGNTPFKKVEEALHMIVSVISKMNGAAAINSIKDENIDLSKQGELILRDEFVVHDNGTKLDAVIFLFEKSIIITQPRTEGPKKNRRDAFVYLDHIVDKYLSCNVCQESPTNFQILFYGKYRKYTHTLQAKDSTTKAMWIKAIEDILMAQFKEEKQRNS